MHNRSAYAKSVISYTLLHKGVHGQKREAGENRGRPRWQLLMLNTTLNLRIFQPRQVVAENSEQIDSFREKRLENLSLLERDQHACKHQSCVLETISSQIFLRNSSKSRLVSHVIPHAFCFLPLQVWPYLWSRSLYCCSSQNVNIGRYGFYKIRGEIFFSKYSIYLSKSCICNPFEEIKSVFEFKHTYLYIENNKINSWRMQSWRLYLYKINYKFFIV